MRRVSCATVFLVQPALWLDETVEHVSKGFLGLTMNCAKCHDHKFDPIKQADYYRMRAFFEPYYVRMDSVPTEPDLTRDGIPRVYDGNARYADIPVRSRSRNQSRQDERRSRREFQRYLPSERLDIKPVQIPLEACQPERRPWVLKSNIEAATKKLAVGGGRTCRCQRTVG